MRIHGETSRPMTTIAMMTIRRFMLLPKFDVMSPRYCGEKEMNLKCLWAVDLHDFLGFFTRYFKSREEAIKIFDKVLIIST